MPNSITSLYTYSKLRKEYLEEPISIYVERPTLRKVLTDTTKASGFGGTLDFKYFPTKVLDFLPPNPKSKQEGSLLECLEVLAKENHFRFYTEESSFTFMYLPDVENLQDTDMYTSNGDVVLDTKNMRANPKIGVATLSVTSNLDPDIKPSTILNTSELLTVGTSTNQDTLEIAEKYLQDKVAGNDKYQTLSVQHKGSNWTKEWQTVAAATSPTKGTTMPTTTWFR